MYRFCLGREGYPGWHVEILGVYERPSNAVHWQSNFGHTVISYFNQQSVISPSLQKEEDLGYPVLTKNLEQ